MILLKARLLAVAAILVSSGPVLANSPDAVVTFNEIHYNPPVTQDAEWVELHNQMAVNIDLSGWSLADGISYTFPKGTIIAGGGFLVVAKMPGHPSLAGVAGVLGPFAGNLSNSGETIDLVSSSGRLMDRLNYLDGGDWPVAADGAGATLAKRRTGTAAENPASWRASRNQGGTPGAVNFVSSDVPIGHNLATGDTVWRYQDNVSAPSGTWKDPSFDDSAWLQGQAPFGTFGGAPTLGITASLVERFRAGAVTGVANGAVFSPWIDTATGDGVSQDAVAGSNPQLEMAATSSGEPAVDFDGNDQFRTSISPGIQPTSGFAYFIVCRAHAAPDSGSVVGGSGDYLFDRDATVDGPLASLKADNGRYGFQTRYDDGSGIGGPVSITPISTTKFQIVAVRRNPALSRFEIWVDGVMEASTPDSGASLTPQPIVIGRHASVASQGFDGDIAELLIYRDALSDADFQSAGAYLESQYGLATAFPDTGARTTLASNTSTSYFRKSFTFTGNPSRTVLKLDRTLTDGAVFYLNGREIARDNLPAGVIDHSTSALSDVTQPTATGWLTVPAGALVNGPNVLAVSLHSAASNHTASFSAALRAEESLPDPDLPSGLQLHEIAASGDPSFFIELRNPTGADASTAGCRLEVIGSQPASVALPVIRVPAAGVVHFTQAQLGFLPATGDKVILRSEGGNAVDVQVVDAVGRGRSDAWPDRWLVVASATPGGVNAFALQQNVVINEICYNPPDVTPASADKQWIEIYNRGATPVDLGGWRFGSGIAYSFPAGTRLAAGGYLVIAKNGSNLSPAAGTSVLGPWTGNLAGGGEKLTLLDAVGNPADVVSYLDGGRWPRAADAGGSTLELRDPRADNSLPESWAASNERSRRGWQTYTYRTTAAASTGPDSQWKEFIFGLLDSGEIMIDDISVTESPDTSAVAMIANGNFESGTSGWRFLGNHRHAQVVEDPQSPGNHVLLLDSKGATEHMHNHVETSLAGGRSVVNGRVYEIRYRARWLGGSNRLNTRLYFNRCAKTTELSRTDTPGTPGAANSTSTPNLGPGFLKFSHSPAVPAVGERVTVTARVADPDGIGSLTLHYFVSGGSSIQLAMTPGAEDPSCYVASIPGQSAASVVRFYIEATDGAAVPATTFFPPAGPGSHALYQVNDGLAATNGLQNIRIIMAPEDKALLYQTNNLMSNERLGCTVIYGEREIYYDIGVRLKSSQRGRPVASRVGFSLGFNDDQLFRGIHKSVSIDRSEGQITGCQEILYDHMMDASGGIPAEYNDLCQVIAPDPANTSHAILQMARFNDVFLDSQFENGSDGTAYEYELIYYPTTTDASGFKLPQPDSVVGVDIASLGDDKERYRWNYLLENNEDVDDYSRLIALCKQFGKTGPAFEEGLGEVIDIDQWLRATAYACAAGAGDSFFANSNHNGIFYARPDGRMLFFPHDLDLSYNATRGLFENSELQKLVANPSRRRTYLADLHEICATVFNRSYMSAWTAHYGKLLPGEDFAAHLDYIDARSTYILAEVRSAVPPVAFAITTNGGANFTAAASPVVLSGQGWIDVKSIRLAGSSVPLEVAWTSDSQWQLSVPLAAGLNAIALEAVDAVGAVVGTDNIVVNNAGAVVLPTPSTLIVSEIYYNPPGSDETTEYVELLNASAVFTLDLSNVSFSTGITATIAGGTLLPPGGRVLVVKDAASFAAAFGSGLPVVATFPDNLSNSGELLELRRADGAMLHSFAFSDQPPWPVVADGDGYSLVLINPAGNPDPAIPAHWRASLVANGGTPGGSDTEAFTSWKSANGNHGDDEDRDGDGFSTRLEYFLGGDPRVAGNDLGPSFSMGADGKLLMSVTRRVTAEGAGPGVEGSGNLLDWQVDQTAELLENVRLSGAPTRDRLTFRITPPVATFPYFSRFRFGP